MNRKGKVISLFFSFCNARRRRNRHRDRLLADLEKEIDDTGFAAKRGVDHIRAVKLGSNGKSLSLSLVVSFPYT